MFHERLKELRVKCGKKQKDLAEFLNISAQSVSKWEKGEALPSITYLPKIAQFYQCDVNAFFAETIKPSAGKKTQPMTQDEYEVFFEVAKCVLVDNQSDKELVEFLENHPAVKEEMIEIIQKNTRNYAKRQQTFFKRQQNHTFLSPEQATAKMVEKIMYN